MDPPSDAHAALAGTTPRILLPQALHADLRIINLPVARVN